MTGNVVDGEQDDPFDILDVLRSDGVATIQLRSPEHMRVRDVGVTERGHEFHDEVGTALTQLRDEDDIRVIVICGEVDGAPILAEPPPYTVKMSYEPRGVVTPDWLWNAFKGIRKTHQAIIEIEKPVIAKVNGHAVNFASSIAFACDLIVAREDAIFMDNHMGLKDFWGFDVVPGDGGAALVPLHMPPARAMEYLMLGKGFDAAELARLGIINYAVAPEKLDETVDDLVRQLLERSTYALGMTKRVAKRRFADHFNMVADAAAAYEWVNYLHYHGSGHDTTGFRG